jgi:hypothetical protein
MYLRSRTAAFQLLDFNFVPLTIHTIPDKENINKSKIEKLVFIIIMTNVKTVYDGTSENVLSIQFCKGAMFLNFLCI